MRATDIAPHTNPKKAVGKEDRLAQTRRRRNTLTKISSEINRMPVAVPISSIHYGKRPSHDLLYRQTPFCTRLSVGSKVVFCALLPSRPLIKKALVGVPLHVSNAQPLAHSPPFSIFTNFAWLCHSLQIHRNK
ncbi:hypothetical protein Tc00.1047053511745.60 [Trypanosoma cruzi]|uniref:Uncharacterized protein n=1 Tax=Trypanosoma cruzi (strain CL Brener) TaxID=353153 RepID=Q4CVL2_TRYCC|nr:hypothetical protein Tc00.1047053511745.60 [Trypanosoma cruzi]EAN84319.1 hypothetical protein Tc00.1047053511745.60 [Trypanosoma cruzi]|eukprot:XP_806170.1 hypothetical protein [Trypanosoma cruzi strain CL Brener]